MFLLFSVLFAVWCFHHSTHIFYKGTTISKNGKSTLLSIYYFGGSEICRLPNFSLSKIIMPLKDLRTVWMIGCQVKTYYLCCSLVLLFRQSFISVAGCRFKPSRWIGKGFGAVYSPTEEKLLQTVYCLTFSYSKRGLATFASDKRGKRMMFYDTMKPIFM